MPMLYEAFRDIFFGGIAGAVGKVVEYPFDTIKVRLQTQPHHVFPTTWSCIRYTYAEEGLWRGFYQGISSPLFGAFLENALLFVSFNIGKHLTDVYTDFDILTKTVLAGAFAGAWASLVLTPVELVKCKLQVSNLENSASERVSVLETARTVVRERGFGGLWQGHCSTLLRECLGCAVWFTTFETLKNWFSSTGDGIENTPWELLISGACAGVCFNASVFPADTVKSTMQTEHVSFSSAITIIMSNNGPMGFYRGIGITLLRAVPANAAIFYIHERLSKL
ncbi:HEL016Cp [Eremothecium sinecaudum]|uniref:HEL016Cp n=1 Tax=Eremothecium sinecaudum TaxID=45286 RepID=A0A0X8HTP5_9SACH|nr:HEL016Cp [Eremothecium sinecaudum]AMD21264.1 HEL016Cp [Eremothecium sinecaudum]